MKHIGIYIHIPFCQHKCYYCDFISFAEKENKIPSYIEAVKKEILLVKEEKQLSKDVIVDTIYVGGGTPSFICEKYIVEILEVIKKEFHLDEKNEITIEVNPGSVTREKLEAYQKAGVNRISIGLQSCDESVLKVMARVHTYETFLECYHMARCVGFDNINVDLMLGVPKQMLESVKDSVKKVIALSPEHISVYSLILEENTKMQEMVLNGELEEVDEDVERQMYWESQRMLKEADYNHYEISNFAKPGFESKHNLNCWSQCEYIGFGLAAHSYLNQERFSNETNLDVYIKNIDRVYEEKRIWERQNEELNKMPKREVNIQELQDKQMQMKEYMLLGLRKIGGISIQLFKQKFSENPIYYFRKELDKLVGQGLLTIDKDKIYLSQKGIDFANIVWGEFI